MDRSKTSNLNVSSLVDLKAELVKKKEEFERNRHRNNYQRVPRKIEKKKSVFEKKNKNIESRCQKDLEAKVEEDNSLAKSRAALEAKALLYEKLSKGKSNLDNDEKGLFLVNFQEKSLLESRENYEKESKEIKEKNSKSLLESRENDEKESKNEIIEDYPATNRDEEWVEYEDCFGRSRMCLRKDLPRDAKISESNKSKLTVEEEAMNMHLLSEDMRREEQRKLWEEEEQEAMKNPIRDIHYQNVLHNEVRSHGVGFYEFSKDEEERSKQLDMLNQLRQQTEKHKSSHQSLLQKRKALMAERLAKVRLRKNIKVEVPNEMDAKVEVNISDSFSQNYSYPQHNQAKAIFIEPEEPSEEAKQLELENKMKEIEDEHKRKAHVRPWDSKKQAFQRRESQYKLSQRDWIEEKRNERNSEFAPLTFHASKSRTNYDGNDNQFHSPIFNVESNIVDDKHESQHFKDIKVEEIPLPNDEMEHFDDSSELKIEDQHDSPSKTNTDESEVHENGCEVQTLEEFQLELSQTLSYFKNK